MAGAKKGRCIRRKRWEETGGQRPEVETTELILRKAVTAGARGSNRGPYNREMDEKSAPAINAI